MHNIKILHIDIKILHIDIKILHIGSTHQQWKNYIQKNFKAYLLNKKQRYLGTLSKRELCVYIGFRYLSNSDNLDILLWK